MDVDKKFRPFDKQKLARSSQKKPVFSKANLKATNLPEKSKNSTKKEDQQGVAEPVLEPVEDSAAAAEQENGEVVQYSF